MNGQDNDNSDRRSDDIERLKKELVADQDQLLDDGNVSTAGYETTDETSSSELACITQISFLIFRSCSKSFASFSLSLSL